MRPPNVIDPARRNGTIACPRRIARPERSRDAEQLGQRRDAGRGVGPGDAAQRCPSGACGDVVDLALELEAVALVAGKPQLQLRRCAALQLHCDGHVAIGARRP